MDISGNLWSIYPNDAPGLIGRDIPGSQIFCHQMVWRPDNTSQSGDVVHVKDVKGRTVFFHGAVAGETQYLLELMSSPLQGPLTLEALESGVLEMSIE